MESPHHRGSERSEPMGIEEPPPKMWRRKETEKERKQHGAKRRYTKLYMGLFFHFVFDEEQMVDLRILCRRIFCMYRAII